jgi:hypothetical protein
MSTLATKLPKAANSFETLGGGKKKKKKKRKKGKKNSMVLVRKRTIPSERPQPADEVSANFS